MHVKKLAGYALFAALTAIFSQIAIPMPGLVPINLATLSVFLAGGLLGPVGGLISQAVYLCLGLVGIPMFSMFRSGVGTLLGPTGGYIIGYLLAALLCGLLVQKLGDSFLKSALSMAVGLAACYALGTAWYCFSTHTQLLPALMACVVPFLLGDAAKIALGSFVLRRLRKNISF